MNNNSVSLYFLTASLLTLLYSCGKQQTTVRLITLDPGHFHAALVQKIMYKDVSPDVYVYAPENNSDLQAHLKKIEDYNTRADNPAQWNEDIYTGADFLEKMIAEHKGNVMIVAGNNSKKTEYIEKALSAGINVLADKPMAINFENFATLEHSLDIAKQKGALLYDIMTERFEITSVLQKELSQISGIYGEQTTGTPENPAIEKESVHLFLKTVSGKPLIRPEWFFDTVQQGEAIADVAVHLVDLVQWGLFPEQPIDYRTDIEMLSANHWTTSLSAKQFQEITGADAFPDFLAKDIENNTLKVFANGEIRYKIKGINARITVRWNYTDAAGGDTHCSIMRGSRANLVIRQGAEEKYKPTLYIEPAENIDASLFEKDLQASFPMIEKTFAGVGLRKTAAGAWEVTIPDKYRNGHEAHFGQVMEHFLQYLKQGSLPEWETPCMIAKYYVTTKGLEMANTKKQL
ncbi:MAG: Gfo/Idh/MocA family oxidoreductase [Dysgonamonadaceae bacterium]|jgi:predicted dehydrogenase|nr:Gfo/Idh/MocA family oxidoreductase [Dysgonamonadaceae bacterium]